MKSPRLVKPSLVKKYTMAGIGTNVVSSDFGGMGDFWSDLVSKTVDSAQKSATKAVTKAVEKFVLNIAGADGKTSQVTLTPEQAAQYQATGTLPTGVLPAGYVATGPSFWTQYQGPIIIGASVLGGLLALAVIYKVIKK